MFLVRTESGTEYEVRNGRITRIPKVNPYLPPDHLQNTRWNGDVFANVTTPTVGERWIFTLTPGPRITTSPVVAVERYCASCDTYGDLFFCSPALVNA